LLTIRNQYPHCQWSDDENAGLMASSVRPPAGGREGAGDAALHIAEGRKAVLVRGDIQDAATARRSSKRP
jgi:hypothetical protein